MKHVTAGVAAVTGGLLRGVVHLLTGVRVDGHGSVFRPRQHIYFANHTSHADFALLWTVLPPRLRTRTRPVAAADYWLATPLRRFLIQAVFAGVAIDRKRTDSASDPISTMARALDDGDSLILFPEGTRNATDNPLLPFKSGIYRLARARPAVELVPVWIANLNRVLPKGERVPVPLLCTVTFGAPIQVEPDETQEIFLERARQALLELSRSAAAIAPG